MLGAQVFRRCRLRNLSTDEDIVQKVTIEMRTFFSLTVDFINKFGSTKFQMLSYSSTVSDENADLHMFPTLKYYSN